MCLCSIEPNHQKNEEFVFSPAGRLFHHCNNQCRLLHWLCKASAVWETGFIVPSLRKTETRGRDILGSACVSSSLSSIFHQILMVTYPEVVRRGHLDCKRKVTQLSAGGEAASSRSYHWHLRAALVGSERYLWVPQNSLLHLQVEFDSYPSAAKLPGNEGIPFICVCLLSK